jgi:cytochrome c-type biogenesis protein CcmF
MDINIVLGQAGIYIALLATLAAIIKIAINTKNNRVQKDSDIRLSNLIKVNMALILGGVVLSVLAMEHALISHDFSLAYVAQNNAIQTPILYTVAGLWSALEGSILLWVLLLSCYITAFYLYFKNSAEPTIIYAQLINLIICLFFLFLVAFPANPFLHVTGPVPTDGTGPNPLLQDNPLVAIHPILLYLGLTGFTIPFSLTLARLFAKEPNILWQKTTRAWLIFPWCCLTLGIIMGAWWSYEVLGWGGFWAWDPVENAALMPWLTATAAMHSGIATEEKRVLKTWTMSLILVTFALTILGTYLTRSGVVESVHAFSDSNIGIYLIVALGVIVLVSLYAITFLGPNIAEKDRSYLIQGEISKPAAFVLNNLLFLIIGICIFIGTIYPVIAEHFSGTISIGPPYYDTLTAPFAFVALILMGVGPVLSYNPIKFNALGNKLLFPALMAAGVALILVVTGFTNAVDVITYSCAVFSGSVAIKQLSLNFKRSEKSVLKSLIGRKGGSMIAHIGILILAAAILSAVTLGQRGDVSLYKGQTATFDNAKITFLKLITQNNPQDTVTEAKVLINNQGPYYPAITIFPNESQGIGTPAINSTPLKDIYITVSELPTGSSSKSVIIGVVIQPFIFWIWTGGFIIFIGGLLSIIPDLNNKKTTKRNLTNEKEDEDLEKITV